MGKLISPNGTLIVATCDTILASADFTPTAVVRDDTLPCGFDFSWSGGSRVHWDTQEARTHEPGDILVEDENGDEWPISTCTYVECEEDDDA